jgi:hypothetical protein
VKGSVTLYIVIYYFCMFEHFSFALCFYVLGKFSCFQVVCFCFSKQVLMTFRYLSELGEDGVKN